MRGENRLMEEMRSPFAGFQGIRIVPSHQRIAASLLADEHGMTKTGDDLRSLGTAETGLERSHWVHSLGPTSDNGGPPPGRP